MLVREFTSLATASGKSRCELVYRKLFLSGLPEGEAGCG
jgi:hypothetical protein